MALAKDHAIERGSAHVSGLRRALATSDSPWTICVRLAVGLVFLPEGIQKLIFPDILGSGRFAAIGLPYPDVLGPFVGGVELVCGTLILLGFLTRLAAMPLLITMVVAILSTKIPILLGHDWWIFTVAKLSRYGFWSFLHETRTDWAMLMGSAYLLGAGGGRWSVDRSLVEGRARSRPP
jgi:putative oxidoreductase